MAEHFSDHNQVYLIPGMHAHTTPALVLAVLHYQCCYNHQHILPVHMRKGN